MAKSLVHKYSFNPATNTVVIDYIYKPERFLIITNVTRNQTIFLFNDVDLGIDSISYNYSQEKTTLVLKADCSAMSSTDKLQIFVESDQQQFEPSPTLLDPVSKFRVSQPENLIDTDFEYGLQSTKWETLEMVKNIPTFFSRTGDSELGIVDITTVNGSDVVTVETSEAHSFATGTPVILIGTRNITCDGTFVVTVVIDSTTFQYKAKAIQNFTGSILADYTQVFPGQVYQGTEFDLTGIDAINTDQGQQSLLTVKTEYPTLFESGTSFFLSNSVGQVNTFVDATQVQPENFNSVSITRTNNDPTGEAGFSLGSVQPYVYTGPTVLYFRNSEVTVNATTGIESITFATNHGIPDNTHWMYVPGEGNAVIGGLTAYTAYYVRIISPNAIYLTTTLGGTTRVNLTGGGADGGVMRSAFIRAYRMTAANTTTEVITFAENHGIANNANQPVLFFPSGGTASNLATSTSLHTPGQLYYTRTTTANTTTVSTTPNGANFNLTSTTSSGIMVPVVDLPDANTLYFPSHNLENNTPIVFTVVSGTAPGGLVSTTTYKVEPVGNDRIRFKNNDNLTLINLTSIGTNVSQYQIETRNPLLDNDSIFAPSHVLRDGLEVTYTNEGGTTIPGLTDEGIYYVFQRTENNFKLATNTAGWKSPLRDVTQSTGVNVTTNVITTGVAHGFTTGDAVQYLSSTPVGGLVNGAFYWVRSVTATTCTLHWTKDGANNNNNIVDLSLPVSGFGTLRSSFLVDITGTGTGTQKFRSVTSSASDGVYKLQNQIDSRTFQLVSNNQIPEREVNLGDSRTFLDLSRSAIRFSAHSLTTGTQVRYETSDTAIQGLTHEETYYVIRVNRNSIQLASSLLNAQTGVAITFESLGSGVHKLFTTSISGETSGSGTISVSVESDRILGSGTNFTAVFAPGDRFIIFGAETITNKTVTSINTTTDVLTSAGHAMPDGSPVIMAATTTAPAGTTNGFIYYTRSTGLGTPANEFTLHATYNDALNNTGRIDLTTAGSAVIVQHVADLGTATTATVKYVNSTTEIILKDPVIVDFSNVSYAVGTALFVRADGFALHRPYDGGVELIPSTNPDAAIIRQTRKYFRYQSGKGIQVSFAVNFSPTITFDRLFVSLDQDKVDKCERDIGYIIDGSALDLALGTNYNARFIGIAETNSIDISPVVISAIEDAQDAIKDLTEVTNDLDIIIDNYFNEIYNIIDNGREAVSNLVFTNPSGGSANRVAAKDKLIANKDFLIAEVNAYVEATYSPTDHDVSKCSRDLKYAIEGFTYDILYGGNQATYDGARFFLYGFADGSFGIIPSHIDQTVGAYERLRDIIGDVVQGIAVTPTAGNTVAQVTSGDNATSTEGTLLEALVQIIVDTIDNQSVPVGVTRTLPDVTWATSAVQDAYAAINTNKATIISTAVTSEIGLTTATAVTRFPHRLTPGIEITVYGADLTGGVDRWNGVYKVTKIIDTYTFQYNLLGVPTDLQAGGLVEFFVNEWQNSRLKCGLFDDQNGLYFEYDGKNLNCCRRSSVQQLSGTASVTFKSGEIVGNNTRFSSQLTKNDRVVIKGQTYVVTEIVNNTLMYILPSYRGVSNDNVIITRTIDTKVPQSDWSIDRCDGTGPSGFFLDIHKIQMAYMDYSWYGAGKVRFGFKDQDGEVIYIHEFVHNNKFTEAYMRSGNLPARYEVENVGIPSYVPSLAHWGTSVIMDGRFDDDKAYVFTASSNTLSITGSASITVSARVESLNNYQVFANNQYRNAGNALLIATPSPQFNNIPANTVVAGTGIPVGTRTRLPADGQISPRQPYLPSVLSRTFGQADGTRNLLLIDRAPTATAGSASNYTVTLSSVATPVVYDQPLISIRLAPSVDTGTPGALGQREIINRMQLILDAVGILSTHSAEIILKLNGQLNNNNWQRVTNPSLSQLIYHSTADTIIGGTTVYSFRAQGGTGTTGRTPVITTADLGDIATLGNSIMGGDGMFPDGPDVITVVARLIEDPSTVSPTNPFGVTGRISWSESQA
jgi:hypothetical protein